MISTNTLELQSLPSGLKRIINNNIRLYTHQKEEPKNTSSKNNSNERKRKSSPSFKIEDIIGEAFRETRSSVFRKIKYEQNQFSDLIGGISTEEALNGSNQEHKSSASEDLYSFEEENFFNGSLDVIDEKNPEFDFMHLGPIRLYCENCEILVVTEIRYQERKEGFWRKVCCGAIKGVIGKFSMVHVCTECRTVLAKIQTK